MFENASKDILKQLNGPKDKLVPPPQDGLSLDAVKRLQAVMNLPTMLDALVGLDAVICARITAVMTNYKLDVPINKQEDRSGAVMGLAGFLLGAYQRVIADPGFAAVTAMLGPVADAITVDDAAARDKRAAPFVARVRQIVLLSLAAGASGGQAKVLLDEIVRVQPRVTIGIYYKESPGSFLAYVGDNGAYCTGLRNKNPFDDLNTRLSGVDPGAGGPSVMRAPVWLSDGKSAGELGSVTFDYIPVDGALQQIFTGSLSFTRDQVAYYTPPRIEVLHELVHVLHNAAGVNREKASIMTGDERATWTNEEEYWTIAGDPVGENSLNEDIGAPDRHGHAGLPLPFLSPATESAGFSLRQHALGQAIRD